MGLEEITFKETLSFGRGLLGFVPMSLIPYFVPSFIRSITEDPHPKIESLSLENLPSIDEENALNLGVNYGIGLGVLGWVAQAVGYYHFAFNQTIPEDNVPEILLIPIATNLLSGFYELGKKYFMKRKDDK